MPSHWLDKSALMFVDAGALSGTEVAATLRDAAGVDAPKLYVSLACETGKQAFAKGFSTDAGCSYLAAPFKPVHGAAASHFCQSFVAALLLDGKLPVPAFKQAGKTVVGGTHFRLWHGGRIKAGRAT